MRCNRAQLADVLGRTLVTIDAYRNEGMPGRKVANQWEYDTAECVKWLIERESEGSGTIDADIKREDLRERSARASLREIELAKQQGSFIHVLDAAEMVETDYAIVKSRMQALPGRVAQMLAAETDPVIVQNTLRNEVAEALEQISAPQEQLVNALKKQAED